MKSEHIAIGSLRRVRNSREELIEILDAVFFGGIVGHVSPPPVVEIRTRGVHHTVQHHFVTVSVRQVFPSTRMDGGTCALTEAAISKSPESITFFIFRIINLFMNYRFNTFLPFKIYTPGVAVSMSTALPERSYAPRS